MWVSDQSLADVTRLARWCQGRLPEMGVGLYVESWQWMPSEGGSSSGGGEGLSLSSGDAVRCGIGASDRAGRAAGGDCAVHAVAPLADELPGEAGPRRVTADSGWSQ